MGRKGPEGSLSSWPRPATCLHLTELGCSICRPHSLVFIPSASSSSFLSGHLAATQPSSSASFSDHHLDGCGPNASESPTSLYSSHFSDSSSSGLPIALLLCPETAATLRSISQTGAVTCLPLGLVKVGSSYPPLTFLAPNFFPGHGMVGARGQLRSHGRVRQGAADGDVHMAEWTQTDSKRWKDSAREESSCREK